MTRKQPPVASIVSRPTTLRRSSRPFLRFHPLSGFVAQLQRDTTAIQRDEFFFLLPSLSSLSLSLFSVSLSLFVPSRTLSLRRDDNAIVAPSQLPRPCENSIRTELSSRRFFPSPPPAGALPSLPRKQGGRILTATAEEREPCRAERNACRPVYTLNLADDH